MRESNDYALILIAEDREDDIFVIRRAFAQSRLINPIHVVSDGEEVIAYLNGDGKFANRFQYPLPELLILDLHLPRLDGFEVLRWVRHQSNLKALRVIVLTSSGNIRDLNLAYELGANFFLLKPVSVERFLDTIMAMNGSWLWTSMAAG